MALTAAVMAMRPAGGIEVALGAAGVGCTTVARFMHVEAVLAVHAPLSFALTAANEAAEERPAVLNRDPYVAGWMVRGRPTAWDTERARLVDAVSYRSHIRRIEPDAEFL